MPPDTFLSTLDTCRKDAAAIHIQVEAEMAGPYAQDCAAITEALQHASYHLGEAQAALIRASKVAKETYDFNSGE